MEDSPTENGRVKHPEASVQANTFCPGGTNRIASKGSFERWFQKVSGDHQQASLLCLPYAGTGSATFGRWRNQVSDDIDLYAAQLPGRDGRLDETPIDEMPVLVEQLTEAILSSDLVDRPVSLLGCSVGAVMAFELSRSLRRHGINIHRLFVAACRPPHSLRATEPVSSLPDDQMVQKLVNWYNAIPADILQNEGMLELLLPTIRADMKLYETYQYQSDEPLGCPITAIGGTDDRIVSVTDLSQWRSETTEQFRHRQFAGDHFFMKSDFGPALKFVCRQLQIRR